MSKIEKWIQLHDYFNSFIFLYRTVSHYIYHVVLPEIILKSANCVFKRETYFVHLR